MLRRSAIEPRPKAGSPLIVIPTAPSGAIVLEAVKVWPGHRDEGTDFQIEQRN
jgi:hypothetical protein